MRFSADGDVAVRRNCWAAVPDVRECICVREFAPAPLDPDCPMPGPEVRPAAHLLSQRALFQMIKRLSAQVETSLCQCLLPMWVLIVKASRA